MNATTPDPDGSFRSLGQLRRLTPYIRGNAGLLTIAILALLGGRLMDALVPQFLKLAVDSLTDPAVPANLALPALAIVLLMLVRFGLFVWGRRRLRRFSIDVAYDLRRRIFRHMQVQGPRFYNRFSTGDVMSRAVNDINTIRIVVAFGWVIVAVVIFSVLTGVAFMSAMSPKLTAWAITPLPLVAYAGYRMSRNMFPHFRAQQDALAAVTTFTQENLNGIRTVQAMAREDFEIGRFHEVSSDYAQKVFNATRFSALMQITMGLLATIAPVIILWYGGHLVLAGEITVGTLVAFFAYLTMVTASMAMIGWALAMFTAAAAGCERIFEMLDMPSEIVDQASGQTPARISGALEFSGLSFTHPGGARPTVQDIRLQIAPGQTVAILGRVGAGKSTILKSVVRLINTPPGQVFLDGHDVCDYPLETLRRLVALVPQDAFLFSAPLRENLTYDEPERSEELIWRAAEAAAVASTFRDLPDGLETLVGERGVTLSGGQKQRTSLARGLIRDTAVLLLDDCFSAVDTATEETILSGLKRLRAGRTTLLISHRVSTARHADQILVIDNGRILESGTHAQLLRSGGYYADLEAIQSNQDQDRQRKLRLLEDLNR